MATQLERTLDDVDRTLGDLRRQWALVGGLAVAVRAEPRLTRDADVAVSVADDDEAEATVRALVADGYRIDATVEHDPTGRLATVRLARGSSGGAVLDLLFASSGIEPEIVDRAEQLEILPDRVAPVARTGHLLAMKLLARDDRERPVDADDLRRLAEVATDPDWDEARTAVDLIAERGFDRGRDLRAALAALRAE